MSLCFFFQAEDGIRDYKVTEVQTCALPIYRYFPEPDLVPLELEPSFIAEIQANLPELPRARRQRFVSQHGLPPADAGILTQNRALAEYFETAVREFPEPKTVANWMLSELLRQLPGDDEAAIAASPITPVR